MANTIRIQLRSDTAENWESVNPILLKGELGLDLTNNRIKIGDGATAWEDLPYVKPEVIDSLTGTGTEDALSAEQGLVLKGLIDGMSPIGIVDNLVTENPSAALSAAQGVVLKALVDSKTSVEVVNDLQTTDTKKALSAAQGVVLKTLIDGKTAVTVLDSLTSTSKTAALSANQGRVLNSTKVDSSAISNESWTFTLSSGSTVTKKVVLWTS